MHAVCSPSPTHLARTLVYTVFVTAPGGGGSPAAGVDECRVGQPRVAVGVWGGAGAVLYDRLPKYISRYGGSRTVES